MPLILFQRDECHLCDLAVSILAEARAGDFEPCWIDGDRELEARYGRRVPVLRSKEGDELDWPFNVEQVRGFLQI